jgi:hypothetical protein
MYILANRKILVGPESCFDICCAPENVRTTPSKIIAGTRTNIAFMFLIQPNSISLIHYVPVVVIATANNTGFEITGKTGWFKLYTSHVPFVRIHFLVPLF